MFDSGYSMLATGYSILDAGLLMLGIRRWTEVARRKKAQSSLLIALS
jgi:hypothetical protein